MIDEVSMLSLGLVSNLDQLRAGDSRIVSFCDFQQSPPVGNTSRGQDVNPKILEHRALLKTWSDCTMFQITKCRRPDLPNFRFYTSLPEDP